MAFDFSQVKSFKETQKREFATNEVRSVWSGAGTFCEITHGFFGGQDSKWCNKEYIVITNVCIMRFKIGEYDYPFSTIRYSHDLKVIDCPTLMINGRSGLIQIENETIKMYL
jgi:hypothetical protein